jgi:hypothetical protein
VLVDPFKDDFLGIFILREEIGFASHEREHGIKEAVDSFRVLEC